MQFSSGWFGSDLGEFRPCDGTYDLYPADSLPPLPVDRFGAGLGWLAGAGVPAVGMPATKLPPGLAVPLPPDFERFMERPDLHAAVPSCTACYWDVSGKTASGPLDDGATLLRFLNDQQGCLYWYLYLLPDGQHRVVCGGGWYDDPYPDAHTDMLRDLVVVAPDFEQFLYRFWIENTAWFELVEDELPWDELSRPVAEYLAHYRDAGA